MVPWRSITRRVAFVFRLQKKKKKKFNTYSKETTTIVDIRKKYSGYDIIGNINTNKFR